MRRNVSPEQRLQDHLRDAWTISRYRMATTCPYQERARYGFGLTPEPTPAQDYGREIHRQLARAYLAKAMQEDPEHWRYYADPTRDPRIPVYVAPVFATAAHVEEFEPHYIEQPIIVRVKRHGFFAGVVDLVASRVGPDGVKRVLLVDHKVSKSAANPRVLQRRLPFYAQQVAWYWWLLMTAQRSWVPVAGLVRHVRIMDGVEEKFYEQYAQKRTDEWLRLGAEAAGLVPRHAYVGSSVVEVIEQIVPITLPVVRDTVQSVLDLSRRWKRTSPMRTPGLHCLSCPYHVACSWSLDEMRGPNWSAEDSLAGFVLYLKNDSSYDIVAPNTEVYDAMRDTAELLGNNNVDYPVQWNYYKQMLEWAKK